MVRPEAAAEAVAVQEQALVQEREQALEVELAREFVSVAKPNLAPRSFDSRYHRNP